MKKTIIYQLYQRMYEKIYENGYKMAQSVGNKDIKRTVSVGKVNSLRRALNLTEQDLGDIMGISGSSVSRRLRGSVPFSREELRRFAEQAHTEEGWFDA